VRGIWSKSEPIGLMDRVSLNSDTKKKPEMGTLISRTRESRRGGLMTPSNPWESKVIRRKGG